MDIFFDFDDFLWDLMCGEMEYFFCVMIVENCNVFDFLMVDFLYVDDWLVDYYGIFNIEGKEFCKVLLFFLCCGLFMYGSVLLIIFNLICIFLVKCGKWILENIFGELLLLLFDGV